MLELKYYVLFSAVQAKLAAAQTAHHDGQAKFNQQIQKLQGEIVSLRNEKEKETRKVKDLVSRLEQG